MRGGVKSLDSERNFLGRLKKRFSNLLWDVGESHSTWPQLGKMEMESN